MTKRGCPHPAEQALAELRVKRKRPQRRAIPERKKPGEHMFRRSYDLLEYRTRCGCIKVLGGIPARNPAIFRWPQPRRAQTSSNS